MSDYPPDWEVLPLGEVVEKITSGGTPKADNPDLYGGNIPFLKIDDITSSSKYLRNHKVTINERGLSESSAKIVPTGTLLLTMYGTIGRCCITTYPVATNQAIASFLGHPRVELEYLYYALESKADEFAVASSQTTQANISAGILKQTPIAIPPLPEQKKIAEILSGIDQNIIQIQKQITSLEVLRTAILEQSLEQLKLKDCPIHPLHEVTKKVTVGIVSKPADHYVSKGVPTLRSMNIKEGKIDYKDLRFISEESNQFFKKSIIRKGDILTVRTGVPGTSAVAPEEIDGANCVDIIISTPAEGVDSQFLCLQINSDRIKSKVLSGQGGLAQQHFNIGEMRILDIMLPSFDTQKAISSAVLSVSQCITSRCKQRSKYEGIKCAIADELLSGRKRVSV